MRSRRARRERRNMMTRNDERREDHGRAALTFTAIDSRSVSSAGISFSVRKPVSLRGPVDRRRLAVTQRNQSISAATVM